MAGILRTGLMALAGGSLACSLAFHEGRGPFEKYEMDGIEYRARTRVSTVDPVRLETIVEATNGRDREAEVSTIGCPVSIRLYRSAARTGLPEWDGAVRISGWRGRSENGAGKAGPGCPSVGREVRVAPGERYPVRISVVEPARVGGFVPPGHYYFTTLVPFRDRTIELISGEGSW